MQFAASRPTALIRSIGPGEVCLTADSFAG